MVFHSPNDVVFKIIEDQDVQFLDRTKRGPILVGQSFRYKERDGHSLVRSKIFEERK